MTPGFVIGRPKKLDIGGQNMTPGRDKEPQKGDAVVFGPLNLVAIGRLHALRDRHLVLAQDSKPQSHRLTFHERLGQFVVQQELGRNVERARSLGAPPSCWRSTRRQVLLALSLLG